MNKDYKEKWGDIIIEADNYDAMIHGCNCFHKMGHGIAAEVARIYPEAVEADKETKYGDPNKLGTFSVGESESFDVVVINAYTQFNPGKDFNYRAIQKALININETYRGKKLAIPMIGAGIAGGDWTIIKNLIEISLTDVDLTIIYWKEDFEKYKGVFPGGVVGSKLF